MDIEQTALTGRSGSAPAQFSAGARHDFAGVGPGRGVGFGRLFDEPSDALLAQVDYGVVGTNLATIGGDFGAFNPIAVGKVVEIVAGLDRPIHVGDNNAVSLQCRRILRIGRRRDKR